MNIILVYLLLVLAFIGLIYLLIKYIKLYKKYSSIIDIDKEIQLKNDDIEKLEKNIEEIQRSYKEKREIYDKLQETINLLSDNLEMMEVGLYEPHYHYDDSVSYQLALEHNRAAQKQLIKDNIAVICRTEWTVEGSKQKGRQMTARNIKLILKAFNGECDAIISNVKWNNVTKMEARIEKLFKDINKLGEPNHITVQSSFMKLKKEELWLAYEYEQKKYDEKEEQRRIREQIREEEKVQKEAEKARIQREKEEEEKIKLEQIRKEAYEQGQLDKAKECDEKIAELEQNIENNKRKEANAQNTKHGIVYIISNLGSFGENVYKIGMTRRDDPMERVNELGDASVPFKFDVHAFIESDNAPQLEYELHEKFKNKSVNRVNYRKEFYNVSLEEIENSVKDIRPDTQVTWTRIAEAQEYRQTQSIIKAENNIPVETKQQTDLPIEI